MQRWPPNTRAQSVRLMYMSVFTFPDRPSIGKSADRNPPQYYLNLNWCSAVDIPCHYLPNKHDRCSNIFLANRPKRNCDCAHFFLNEVFWHCDAPRNEWPTVIITTQIKHCSLLIKKTTIPLINVSAVYIFIKVIEYARDLQPDYPSTIHQFLHQQHHMRPALYVSECYT